jgi:hypothetical protein
MLDPKTIVFDKPNSWRGLWYLPTYGELYIINLDGEMVAKVCLTKREGEWPMWFLSRIAKILPIDKEQTFEMIVHAWGMRVIDYLASLNEYPQRQPSHGVFINYD